MKDYKILERDGAYVIDSITEEVEELSEKISQYRALAHLQKQINDEMALLKPALVKANVNEMFIDDKEKVYIKEGAMQSTISPIKVYDKMVELNRGREFFDVCTVSASALSKIDGGDKLVTEFKVNTTRKAGALKVDKMTANDLKEAATKVD